MNNAQWRPRHDLWRIGRQHWCERKHYILKGSVSKMSRLSRQQEAVPPDAPDQMINVYVKSIAMLNGQRSLTISINVNATVPV